MYRILFSLIKTIVVTITLLSTVCHTSNVHGQADSTIIERYVQQARGTMVSFPDSSRQIARNFLTYAANHDHSWGQAQALIFIGSSHHRQGTFDSAVHYFDKALVINETLQDTIQIATCNLNKGMCFVSTGEYERGAQMTLESMRLYELVRAHEPRATGGYIRCFNIMGQVYYFQNDFNKALDYFQQYLDAATEASDTLLIGSANTNIGATYFELKQYEKALQHDLKAAQIHQLLNNPMGYANAIQNIAIGLKQRKQYTQALKYYDEALKAYDQVPNLKGVSETYYNIGELYWSTGNFKESEKNYRAALDLSNRIGNKEAAKWATRGLSKVFAGQGRHELALEYYKTYHKLSDSLINEANLNRISELEIAYQTEQKEQQITTLSKEKELQASIIKQNELQLERNQAIVVALLLLFVIASAMGIFLHKRHRYRQQIKHEEEKNILKTDQIRAVIQSQEEERKRFAMDLHDDFGQLISALRININQLQAEEPTPQVRKSNGLLDRMYQSLKNIAFNLMPQTLVEQGLTPALEELCHQLNELGAMQFKVRMFEVSEDSMPTTHKVGIYRVVQEILNNVIKYAGASKVDINLTGMDDGLSIVIEDDGKGFDSNVLTEGHGNGWRNISSRLDLVQGTIDYDTSPGRNNTTVSIFIPFHKEQKIAA